jgi:CDP-diacylglycerol--glycerol-3-phosphate 3-phosphatidyltransferase
MESRGRSLKTLRVAKTKTAVQLIFLLTTLTLLVVARLPGAIGSAGAEFLRTSVLYVLAAIVAVFTAGTGIVYLFSSDRKPA